VIQFLELALRSFWHFVGILFLLMAFAALVEALLNTFILSWSRTLRTLNIRKHGWPPPHCNGDGDLNNQYGE
jgi:hypothetical protein